MHGKNYFEGLRGVLAIIVIIHHFILLFHPVTFIGSFSLNDFKYHSNSFPILIANTPLNLFMNGNWAVCMFFVLSGYVLSLKYIKSNNPQALQLAILKRYFRLFIPVLACCLIIYLFHLSGLFQKANYPQNSENFEFSKGLFTVKPGILNILKNALLQVPLEFGSPFLPVLWSISCEFIFSILLFVFLLATHNFNKRWLMFIIIILVLLYNKKNYGVLFFAGSAVAVYEQFIYKKLSGNPVKYLLLLLGLFLAGIPSFSEEVKEHTIYGFTLGWPKLTGLYFRIVSSVLLLIYLLNSKKLQNVLASKPLIFAGKISFSMYLLHLPLLYVFGGLGLHMSHGTVNLFLLFLLCFILCLLSGLVFYKFVDQKGIQFSGWFASKFIKPL